jgi:hypothetical protein
MQNQKTTAAMAWGQLNNYDIVEAVLRKGTRLMFKKNEPTDIQLVYKASSWLGISEFQIFSDAWQAWYNEKPSEKRMESYFIIMCVLFSIERICLKKKKSA